MRTGTPTGFPEPPRLFASLRRLTGLSGCCHDYTGGALTDILGHDTLNHLGSFCSLAKRKSGGGERRCIACDSGLVQSRLVDSGTVFVKKCHAGACELVLPIRHNGAPAGVLFMGPFRWPAEEPLPDSALVQPAGSGGSGSVGTALAGLPEIDASRLGDIAPPALLLVSHIERCLSAGMLMRDVEGRGYELRIRDFLRARSAGPVRLCDLARHLHLSESRTSQVVREKFGATFPHLLAEHRLTHAENLLMESHLTIASVARSVGFDDVAYFHRVFKQRTGTTPARYRRQHWRGVDEV